MRLRVRFTGQTRRIVIEDSQDQPPTLADLTAVVKREFQVESCSLSLNGNDTLEGADTTLTAHGIVNGDLVHLLSSQPEDTSEPLAAPSPGSLSVAVQGLASTCTSSARSEIDPSPQPTVTQAQGTSSLHGKSSSSKSQDDCGSSTDPTLDDAVPDDIELPPDNEAIQDGEVNRYLSEPMLIQDSTDQRVPQPLQSVYEQASVGSECDAIFVVLHVLMTETGFSTQSGADSVSGSVRTPHLPLLSHGWNSVAPYNLPYTHPAGPGVTFSLVGVTLGPLLMVHGRVEGVQLGQKCQVKIKPSDYIDTLKPDAAQSYSHLPKLSRLFKDSIAHPMIQLTREALDLPAVHGLMGLVEEIKLQILTHLDVRSLTLMAQVCSHLHDLARDQRLWRRLYLRHFGRRTDNDLSQNWRLLYKEKYHQRKELREQMRNARFVVPPFVDRPNPPYPFIPVYPPGFVGGDYDRDPSFPGIPGMYGPRPGVPFPRPRHDPIGPLPWQQFPPGRGGGLWDGRARIPRPPNPFGGSGGFGGFF